MQPYEKIEHYLRYNIDSMYSCIEYSVDHNLDGSYAKWDIERYYAKALGALMFAKNYMHIIDNEQYDELSKWLIDEYREALRQARSL